MRARRAHGNWLDSITGRRRGRRLGRPRFRSRKDRRQAIRLTRNGFAVTGRGVRIAKVGDVRVRWSRELPASPSSVSIVREADGRYYASFVVDCDREPLAPAEGEVGLDLGLNRLLATSDGQIVENPRLLRRRQRRLAQAQRALARKQPGSANRAKARARVAAEHRKVRDARRDFLHKLALDLIRENQAIYVEDLATAGLARTRLARSVHDAGWATLIRLLEEKADMYGRTVVKIDRWYPSSQTCSTCGHRDGLKPLAIRSWTCSSCGDEHDRDLNAATNILCEGRRVAAGLAETETPVERTSDATPVAQLAEKQEPTQVPA